MNDDGVVLSVFRVLSLILISDNQKKLKCTSVCLWIAKLRKMR